MDNATTTLDGLLNRRVMLKQPAQGYRVAIDTVFLAAAVPALAGDRILDMGCGVGGAMLCLAYRVPGITGLGIEIQSDLAKLCHDNIAQNVFASGLTIQESDITRLSPNLYGVFDHALMNPPYHDETKHDASVDIIKRTANTEKEGDLDLWIKSAAYALKPSGTLTLIHRADRRQDILLTLQNAFGEVEILPLLPKEGSAPKRLIIRARKNAFYALREYSPFILHKAAGGYTDASELVLRHSQKLAML